MEQLGELWRLIVLVGEGDRTTGVDDGNGVEVREELSLQSDNKIQAVLIDLDPDLVDR